MSVFFWGAVGGIAPEVVRLWRLREKPWTPPTHYWPISAAMVLLCGGMALLAAAPEPYSAFYVGIATPYLVSAWAAQAASSQPTSAPVDGRWSDADEPTDSQRGTIRVDEVRPQGIESPQFRQRVGLFFRALYRS
jgi:hypothetical protein